MYVFDGTSSIRGSPRLLSLPVVTYWMLLLIVAGNVIHDRTSDGYDGDSCELSNGSLGVCRPANQCSWLKTQNKPPEDLVTCSFDKSLPIVCCMQDLDSIRIITPAKRISEVMCNQFPETTRLQDHIAFGQDAKFGEFPHMAALAYMSDRKPEKFAFRCGASLISPRFLLTAAHCTTGALFARLGLLDLNDTIDEPIDIPIRNVTRHPDYNLVTVEHDIALLELEEEVPANLSYAHPACLYTQGSAETLGPDVRLSVQGWGSVQVGDPKQPPLQHAAVYLVDRETCQRSQVPSRRNRNGLHPTQICALGKAQNGSTPDTCVGDSGGPLELIGENHHYVVGIISSGYACATTIPGLYTAIAPYIDWIESIVWPQE